MRVLLALVATLWLAQELPPPFPRDGTTMMLENERVVVWNISWLRQDYPLHRHRNDMTGVYYTSGDRVIISPEGEQRSVHTDAWGITFQRAGLTHSERGTSEQPLRSVFIELKQPSAGAASVDGTRTPFPIGSPTERLDNDRVSVWEYGPGTPVPRQSHRHPTEAVVVWFDAAGSPAVRYIERGTTHESDAHPEAVRTFVFEIR
jgi:hypothetical protein